MNADRISAFFARIIYHRRFRSAENIRRAAVLLGENDPVAALFLLRDTRRKLHGSLLPVYALTLGQVLLALDKTDEATNAFRAARDTGNPDVASRAAAWLDRMEPPSPADE